MTLWVYISKREPNLQKNIKLNVTLYNLSIFYRLFSFICLFRALMLGSECNDYNKRIKLSTYRSTQLDELQKSVKSILISLKGIWRCQSFGVFCRMIVPSVPIWWIRLTGNRHLLSVRSVSITEAMNKSVINNSGGNLSSQFLHSEHHCCN